MKSMVFAALALAPVLALSTPGGVDANGCHTSKKIGYHCHPSTSVRKPERK
ncbi:MAG: YHYH domain-containing protein [Ramlibacter sp.]|nr:YHYH domain-containing protein [Ramlibacter sp.]